MANTFLGLTQHESHVHNVLSAHEHSIRITSLKLDCIKPCREICTTFNIMLLFFVVVFCPYHLYDYFVSNLYLLHLFSTIGWLLVYIYLVAV